MTIRNRLVNLYGVIADEFNQQRDRIASDRPLPPMPVDVQIPSNTGQLAESTRDDD